MRRERDPQVTVGERRRRDGRLFRQLCHIEQPLTLRAVAPIRAVVEQPNGGEAAPPPVGPLDRHLVDAMRDAGDEPLRATALRASTRACFDDGHSRPFR
jgi:hypothetical protein